jgi:hypothetical protein
MLRRSHGLGSLSVWLQCGLILTGAKVTWGLDMGCYLAPDHKHGSIQLSYVPADQPIAAVELVIRFKEKAQLSTVTLTTADSGVWSQITPELFRQGNEIRVAAIAPNHLRLTQTSLLTICTISYDITGEANSFSDVKDTSYIVTLLSADGKELPEVLRYTPISAQPSLNSATALPRYRQFQQRHIFSFHTDKQTPVKATVTDIQGALVYTISDGIVMPGSYTVSWDGKTSRKAPLSSGMYIMNIALGRFSYSRIVRYEP